MKRVLAASGAILIMGGVIWTGSRRQVSSTSIEARTAREPTLDGGNATTQDSRRQDPELQAATDRIEALLDVARRGDVGGYLAAFGGPLRARLEHQADERGRAAFAAGLRRAARARTSHAVFKPEPEGEGTVNARIIVESTFADRIERQTYHLARSDAGWHVTDVETARDHVPKNPLGSLATFHEPEGVPVVTREAEAPIEERRD
jgi:hypothetical protein